MPRPSTATSTKTCASAYRVRAPHASDAIGHALRGAFEDESGLPEDMAAMLRQLNRLDGRTH